MTRGGSQQQGGGFRAIGGSGPSGSGVPPGGGVPGKQSAPPGQYRVLAVRCPAWDGHSQPPPLGDWASDRESDPAAGQGVGPEARVFERVVSTVGEFCPRIEVLRPGICAIEARGPASYFGGEAELARGLTQAVSRLGFDCGAGIADGMFAALLAARDGLLGRLAGAPGEAGVAGVRGQPAPAGAPVVIVPPGATPAYLAPRSVAVLGQPDLADLLIRLGIETLGEFAALPAAEVENRFGPPGLLAHRVARGLDPRPLSVRPPAADMSVQIEFDPPVEQSERVVFAAKSLAGQMHAKLAAGGLGCVRMQVQVVCADGQEITRLWRHDGLLTEFAVAERVRWQLDGWQPADRGGDRGGADGGGGPGGERDDDGAQVGGICRLRLIPDQLVRDQGRQLGLWGDAMVSDRVARAAIRIQAMLGHDAVRQPVLTGGRGPGDQVLAVPFGEPRPAERPAGAGQPAGRDKRLVRPAGRPWPGKIPPPAPATVYPEPRPARVSDDSGEPVTVTGRGLVSAAPAWLSVGDGPPLAVIAWTGPWPVTERWWDPARADRRARFQLVTVDGNAWLAIVRDGQWLIEASYS